MPRKGNGIDLANDYLRQIVEKLGSMENGLLSVRQGLETVRQGLDGVQREQQAMRSELKEHGLRLSHIEDAVRQIASFAGQEFQDLKRRVETLERKAA